MVNIILEDMDASKVMADELQNLIPLQLNPESLGNYKFNNTIAMQRIIKYNTDLDHVPAQTI
ncbi:MAG: hypothetical protein EZS28_044488, partial [Streblomastix strix]